MRIDSLVIGVSILWHVSGEELWFSCTAIDTQLKTDTYSNNRVFISSCPRGKVMFLKEIFARESKLFSSSLVLVPANVQNMYKRSLLVGHKTYSLRPGLWLLIGIYVNIWVWQVKWLRSKVLEIKNKMLLSNTSPYASL